jgi:hypothetical protein
MLGSHFFFLHELLDHLLSKFVEGVFPEDIRAKIIYRNTRGIGYCRRKKYI